MPARKEKGPEIFSEIQALGVLKARTKNVLFSELGKNQNHICMKNQEITEMHRIVNQPKTGVFSIKFVSFKYAKSKEINPSRTSQPTITGVNSLHIICNECSHEWQSNSFDKDAFKSLINSIIVKCPCCGASENIEINKLSQFKQSI